MQNDEPATWRAFCRRIHGIYHFDNANDKEKLLADIKKLDTTDEPYDPQKIIDEIKKSAETKTETAEVKPEQTEFVPLPNEEDLPW